MSFLPYDVSRCDGSYLTTSGTLPCPSRDSCLRYTADEAVHPYWVPYSRFSARLGSDKCDSFLEDGDAAD
jgi:hypothetical protein